MSIPSPASDTPGALTLRQLAALVGRSLAVPALQSRWVVAELSDVRTNNGHCYLELLEKDPATGAVLARMRAAIWANVFVRLNALFTAATGQRLASGLKVMVCGTVSFHAAFGMSFVISQINPAYTMGEAERRRREILQRLKAEGILGMNREIQWPVPALRVAVISAAGAAGYGDFMNQLYGNPSRLRFRTALFPAVMQGERTVATVIAALESIAADADRWDCVVIIRGGGATSDLMAFDDYDLAANVAQFPLPVIVGIGHERDVTVLDYVANMRVKTPTAAAEWLVAQAQQELDGLDATAAAIVRAASDKIAAYRMQVAYQSSTLAAAPRAAWQRALDILDRDAAVIGSAVSRHIVAGLERISMPGRALATAATALTSRASERLTAKADLLEAYSPQATLRRGFSLTTFHGRAVTDASSLPAGAEVTTRLASGEFTSTVKTILPQQ